MVTAFTQTRSRMRGRVGCAVCILENKEIFKEQLRLSDDASVFMAELKAIEAAIIAANAHHCPSKKTYFLIQISPTSPVQSQQPHRPIASIKSFCLSTRKQHANYWTKAHVGTEGNERADRYAKEATTKDQVDLHIGLYIKHIKAELTKAIKSEWQNQWSSSSKRKGSP
ncbi:uncharacterized protein CEXT_367601 [Caerostris extrusa]|uniref:RNase H type-1 domain-containing protein n=1 Tax=Caerostris extrusa TaxID=172846 RepID=A0AAV4TAR2_CAEEX|nr:uncharacterized protein CEXT_367601 [Caerostris extrusa]